MKVLLVRLSAMGDVVQSLGAAAALAAARPDLRLTFLVQRSFAPLLAGLPWLEAVLEHDRDAGFGGLVATARRLRRPGFDAALDLQGNWKSALLVRLSGARERIGVAGPWRQEPASAVLLGRRVAVPGPRHPGRCSLAVVRELAPGAAELPPRLLASAAEVEQAAREVEARGLDPARPFRVVVLGDPADPRSQRPGALAAEVARSPHPVLLLAGPAEAAVPAPAAPLWRQGPGQLRLLVALGRVVAGAGGDVVGPDQGPTHVLAAAGARAVVLYGPQDPACTAPPGAEVRRHPSPPACMPCRSRRCRHPEGPVCMDFTSGDGVPPPG